MIKTTMMIKMMIKSIAAVKGLVSADLYTPIPDAAQVGLIDERCPARMLERPGSRVENDAVISID